MIRTIYDLKNIYKDYSNIYNKIASEVKAGRLIEIRRGLYEDNPHADPLNIANHIVYPSYISFESALAYHNMIPERVVNHTSATYKKNKTKAFKTPFGTIRYRDIPEAVYPYGIISEPYNDSNILIATKEKALLDMLYIVPPCNSVKSIKALLFDDLRISEDIFHQLNFNEIIELGSLYKNTTVKYFIKYVKEIQNND